MGTEVAQMKTPPPAGSQPQDPAAGLQIYHSDEAQPSATFAAAAGRAAGAPGRLQLPPPRRSSAAALPAARPAPTAAQPAPTIESLATAANQSPRPPRPSRSSRLLPACPAAAAEALSATATRFQPSGLEMVLQNFSLLALLDRGFPGPTPRAPGSPAWPPVVGKKVEAIDKNGA
ncbi:hypothetical protein ACRAWD_24725 [Caulobacter segnis]